MSGAEVSALRDQLKSQLATSWKLFEYHIEGVDDQEILWRPASRGVHVTEDAGVWRGEWPEDESYEMGPPSMAWLTWHIGFWWSMTLDHSFGAGELRREDVTWPGDAGGTRRWLEELHERWTEELEALPDQELGTAGRTRWPFTDRPFYRVAGWVNIELMKNAAEIGYCRFLYATRSGAR